MADLYVIINYPRIEDAEDFHFLISDAAIQTQFINFRGNKLEDARVHLDNWITINDLSDTRFLRLIRMSPYNVGEVEIFDSSNSYLVGFISNSNEQSTFSNAKQTLNFAIHSEWSGQGLMTRALEMTLDYLRHRGFNYVAALVLNDNLASKRVLLKAGFIWQSDRMIGDMFVYHFENQQ